MKLGSRCDPQTAEIKNCQKWLRSTKTTYRINCNRNQAGIAVSKYVNKNLLPAGTLYRCPARKILSNKNRANTTLLQIHKRTVEKSNKAYQRTLSRKILL